MSEASDPVQQAEGSPGLSPPEVYRPLSILALAGFAAAVLYALFILVGGLVALFQREPWLLPVWVFLIPVGAALLCWLSWSRIQESEGTLGGAALARWGIGLSLVCGLLYGAYYAATFFAVRQQARVVSDRFIELLQKGDVERAFLLMLPPLEQLSARDDPRTAIELSHNTPLKGDMGQFSGFKQAKWVRFLQVGGDQCQIRPLGVSSWGHSRKGYHVTLGYHVDTPMAAYDIEVMVVGQEVRSAPVKGRQWYISIDNTGLTMDSLRMNEEGTAFHQVSMGAMAFANLWMSQAEQGQWTDMYLETLPPSDRQRLRQAGDMDRLSDAATVLGPAPFALQEGSAEQLSRGLEAFSRGSIVVTDPATFWAPARSREEIVQRVKNLFDPKQANAYRFRLLPERVPGWTRTNGELIYSFAVSLSIMDAARRRPQYVVEAELRVGAPEDKVSQSSPPWRIIDLQLVSARSAPVAPEGPERPEPGGRPGMP